MKKHILLLVFLGFLIQCAPQETVVTVPTVTTGEITAITSTTATCSGNNVTDDGGADVTVSGVCWSTTSNPTTEDSKTEDGVGTKAGTGSFTSNLTGLAPNTTYYVRAYATNSKGTAYGEQRTFTTTAQQTSPTVTTGDVSNITTTTATYSGNVTSDGGAAVTARGVCWSTSENPTTANSKTTDGAGTGAFISSLTDLTPNTTYYIRAYATNAKGTSYGEQKTFTTEQEKVAPSVTTGAMGAITTTTATCSDNNVTADGGAAVTARGVCWSTSENPTTSNSKTTDGAGTGAFTSNLTSLTPNTTYYVRAYATNAKGTSYGEQKTFTTNAEQTAPTVTTGDVTNITTTAATCSGDVTSDGGASVTARGVCWSTSENPTTSNSKTTDGTGTGAFTSSLTGLTPNTTYYVRAYATNSVETSYGEQRTFTTEQEKVAPSVTTGAMGAITTTTATCSDNNVTADGGAAVTARGVCWSTSENPTTSNSKTTDGAGTGAFTSNLTSLTPNTTYYVRAYATNAKGTSYGEQKTFTTNAEQTAPTVTTGDVTNITTTAATCSGDVTSDGGASVTARGVCWSTSENPTTSNSKTTDGTGTGAFTSSLTGLTPNTTYYVRAYATNSVETSYGEQRSFESQPEGVNEPGVYRVRQMGTLGTIINQTQKDTITTMIVLGEINKADFEVLRTQIPQLRYLDLKDVTCEGAQIPNQAFNQNKNIVVIILPKSITKIGSYAFYGCTSLTGSLILPDGLKTIDDGAFSNCPGFTGSLNLPDGLTTIGGSAFSGCSGFTGSLNLPDGLTTIGSGAFYECTGFTGTLNLPDGLTTIENSTFRFCSGFTGSLTLPVGLTTIGNTAFAKCSGFTGSLILPDGLTTIGNGAFEDCTGFNGSLTLSVGLTTIGDKAFNRCSGFTGSLTLPGGLKTIGNTAFDSCSGFTGSLTFPDELTTIGNFAFNRCSGFTGSLNLPDGLTTIGNFTFSDCSGFTGSLILPDGLTTIGNGAFENCSGFTGSLNLPVGLITIGTVAFSNCDGFSGSLILPNKLTTVGDYAFGFCSGFTGSLNLPGELTTIGKGAFTYCTGFSGLVMGNKIATIHDSAFGNCSNISGNVIFPISLLSIRNKGFLGCNKVDAFRFPHTTPPPYYTDMLPGGATVEVPTSAVDTYKATDGWKDYNIVGY